MAVEAAPLLLTKGIISIQVPALPTRVSGTTSPFATTSESGRKISRMCIYLLPRIPCGRKTLTMWQGCPWTKNVERRMCGNDCRRSTVFSKSYRKISRLKKKKKTGVGNV
uniref:Uncharacterized protein n=1 Tax=Hyaloperonospora arabidopsidis (strain Emoy2) TaxID=559515 RepID=M4B872_HYAAE